MRLISKSVLIVVAALALTGVTAAAASAHEWLVNEGKVKTLTPVTNSGTFTIERKSESEGSETLKKCSLSGKGTVAAEGKGTVTEWKLTGCSLNPHYGGQCKEGTLTASATELPWKTELGEGLGKISNLFTQTITWSCKVTVLEKEELWTVTCKGDHAGFLSKEKPGVLEQTWLNVPNLQITCSETLGSLLKGSGGTALTEIVNHIQAENKELSLSFN